MANNTQTPSWLIFVPCWGLGALLLAAYLRDSGILPRPPDSFFDVFFLLLAIVLSLVPFASKIKLLNFLEIQRKLERTKEDLEVFKSDTRQSFAFMANVQASAAASNTTNVYNVPPDEGQKDAPLPSPPSGPPQRTGGDAPPAAAPKRRSATEYKILNTLWNKQVEKFPSLQPRFTFRINSASPEFLAFHEAGNRLLGEGLIDETDQGQFLLTDRGLRFCEEQHQSFPDDMWFNRVPLNEGHLAEARRALGSGDG